MRANPNRSQRAPSATASTRPHFLVCLRRTPLGDPFVHSVSEALQTTKPERVLGRAWDGNRSASRIRPTPQPTALRRRLNLYYRLLAYICLSFSVIDLPVITPAVSHCSSPPTAIKCTPFTVHVLYEYNNECIEQSACALVHVRVYALNRHRCKLLSFT